MKRIRSVIVDDEPPARSLLRSVLSVHADLEIVGEADSVGTSVRLLDAVQPDVVFLDIRMPDGTGFDVLSRVRSRACCVVFVTAYDEFAVQAFRDNALDYLLKPIEPERVAASVDRILERIRGTPGIPISPMDEPIGLRDSGSAASILPRDVLWISSEANYSRLELLDGRGFIVRQTLSAWSAQLPRPPFLKLDRCLIVNLQQVIRAEFGSSGGIVFFGSGRQLDLGKQAAVRLRLFLGSAQGMSDRG